MYDQRMAGMDGGKAKEVSFFSAFFAAPREISSLVPHRVS
jgi:hypothetical protein